jgi:hypothetical protein
VKSDRLAGIKDSATRPRRTVPVILNGDLRERIAELVTELAQLEDDARSQSDRRLSSRSVGSARAEEIHGRLDELYARAEEDTLYVVLEGMDGTLWRALIAEHMAPRDDKGNATGGWGPLGVIRETLEEPLIRACVVGHREHLEHETVEPISPDTLDWLIGWATAEQRETLFLAGWMASRADDAIPLRPTRSTTLPSVSA